MQLPEAIQPYKAKTDLSQLQQQFKQIRTETQATNSASQGFFGNLKSQVKSSIATMLKYQLAYMIIQKTIQAIKSMTKAVCELDATLTEFNKVADLSTEQLEKFAYKAFEAADKIGRTGKDMIEAATEFKRAGYNLEQSLEMGNRGCLPAKAKAFCIHQRSPQINGFPILECKCIA